MKIEIAHGTNGTTFFIIHTHNERKGLKSDCERERERERAKIAVKKGQREKEKLQLWDLLFIQSTRLILCLSYRCRSEQFHASSKLCLLCHIKGARATSTSTKKRERTSQTGDKHKETVNQSSKLTTWTQGQIFFSLFLTRGQVKFVLFPSVYLAQKPLPGPPKRPFLAVILFPLSFFQANCLILFDKMRAMQMLKFFFSRKNSFSPFPCPLDVQIENIFSLLSNLCHTE